MFNILVVEDDRNLKKLIVTNLKNNNYKTFEANNGEEALEVLDKNYIDLMITDVMMPKKDGFELVKDLRTSEYKLPIILITAKNEMKDKKQGFSIGADDYMVKPFDIEELLLRVEALLRRSESTSERKIVIGDLIVDYNQMTVLKHDKVYNFTLKEFQLLYKLLSKVNNILTRQELMEEIWGLENDSDYRTIDVHIKRIREKLLDVDEIEICTIRGLGYKCIIKKEGK